MTLAEWQHRQSKSDPILEHMRAIEDREWRKARHAHIGRAFVLILGFAALFLIGWLLFTIDIR